VLRHLLKYLAAVVVFGGAFAAADASAELVFLANGRHLSVKTYRFEGDSIVLSLRQGGEIVCAREMIQSIAPDEVPYPEPVVQETAASEPLASVPFSDLIDAAAARHGVDVRLVRAVVQVESAYRANARSKKGAKGLMQLMPQTARQYSVNNPYDPASNLDAGVKHLKLLLERFELKLALAAYNAGEAAVRRFGGIPPFQETRDYVRQVLGILQAPRQTL
jgi:soluble lytic murein transglycosylase-like protein